MTGASGQDGSYLVECLAAEGVAVHAAVRPGGTPPRNSSLHKRNVSVHELDIRDASACMRLVADIQPEELYNLGGQSSVAASFANPDEAWTTNAHAVASLLEAVRVHSPHTRFYQSSSSEMFGSGAGAAVAYDESAPLRPESPYGGAKAAAHILCGAYRRAFDMRVACGILFNHESSRRPATFLTRKVVDHVRTLGERPGTPCREVPPLLIGNLAASRDWGFAPDYVDGMRMIARQIDIRAAASDIPREEDSGRNYRDYVLGTGKSHTVWQLVDRAFALAGFPLEWDRSGGVATWQATFAGTSTVAVAVEPSLLRPSDPGTITADASRARRELGWSAPGGLDRFLAQMLGPDAE